MLTQGWRRFAWKSILAGRFPVTDNPIEKDITINGLIIRDLLSIPYPNSQVTLKILNTYNDIFETHTDKKGRFRFTGLNYPDTISVRIEAIKPTGGKNLVISVDQNVSPGNYNIYPSEKRIGKMKSRNLKYQRYYQGKRTPEDESSPPIYGEADDVIYVDPKDASTYNDVVQYLQGRVAGVYVTNDNVIIRGASTIYGSTDPLFLVDEAPISVSTAKSINLHDVQRIEILKGPKAAFYGSQGANGVIAIYTRKGYIIVRALSFKMLGYYSAREFYAPKYEMQKDSTTEPDYRTTIYWNPLIETNKDGNATVSFYNSDAETTFNAKVEGSSYTGNVGSCEYNYKTIK
jgi:TonB-dependent SusC/RagA subfamily outer membrane receptor